MGGGPSWIKYMLPGAQKAGVNILTQTRAISLVTDATGAVVGAIAKDNQGSFKINAKATILACGGFEGNSEMLTRYISPLADYVLLRGEKQSAPGDNIAFGEQVEAETVAMQIVHGYIHIVPFPMPFPLRPLDFAIPPDGTGIPGTPAWTGVPGITQNFPYGIVVNTMGENSQTKPLQGLGTSCAMPSCTSLKGEASSSATRLFTSSSSPAPSQHALVSGNKSATLGLSWQARTR